MDAKISVTTRCNARCKTCPVWTLQGDDMPAGVFKEIYKKLMTDPRIDRILLNNTGDMYVHPDRARLWEIIEATMYKPVILTTNAAEMDYCPKVTKIIISFNGYDKASYEYTTGLPFDETVANIRSFYDDLSELNAEIHTLAWGDIYVPNIEERVRDLWGDFPGRVRVSYKTDNQQEHDIPGAPVHQAEARIPCDYLDKVNIWPDGSIIQCAHDFRGEGRFGNILTTSVFGSILHPDRMKLKAQHAVGAFPGLCATCNYNTPTDGRIVYVRG